MANLAVTVTVTGVERTAARIKRAGKTGTGAVGAALFHEGENIMRVSRLLVPVATGNLRASGHVDLPKQALGVTFVELGYGGAAAQYALSVHENPRAGKTGGVSPLGVPYSRNKAGKPTWSTHPAGQWKYLEQPFREAVPGLQARIQAFIAVRMKVVR